ncbi:hypothetical protein M513_11641 [Trichuris suis]|uniref:Uncharacterized protein n=1 Tax=Trichuris suis TaxID=68888 RepID=A0A085LR84_9BILA|nr:hypothetical protein M513_11641 [Trichuris suis]
MGPELRKLYRERGSRANCRLCRVGLHGTTGHQFSRTWTTSNDVQSSRRKATKLLSGCKFLTLVLEEFKQSRLCGFDFRLCFIGILVSKKDIIDCSPSLRATMDIRDNIHHFLFQGLDHGKHFFKTSERQLISFLIIQSAFVFFFFFLRCSFLL